MNGARKEGNFVNDDSKDECGRGQRTEDDGYGAEKGWERRW